MKDARIRLFTSDPDAGVNGGELLFQGTIEELIDIRSKLTLQKYLRGEEQNFSKKTGNRMKDSLNRPKVRGNNLKTWIGKISPECSQLPWTGRISFGKIHAYQKVLYPALGENARNGSIDESGKYDRMKGLQTDHPS